MTKTNDDEIIAEVLMGRVRIKTVPLSTRSYEFINATLRRDSLLDETPVGTLLFQKTVPLFGGLHLSLHLYNGSYRGETRPHLEIDIHKCVSYKPNEDVDMPLDWKTVTDKLPEDMLFNGASLGIGEDYHIRFKATDNE